MFTLSRRDFLTGTAATTAALSLGLTPSEIWAAATPVGKQNAGFYRYKVGDFEVTQLADGARTRIAGRWSEFRARRGGPKFSEVEGPEI